MKQEIPTNHGPNYDAVQLGPLDELKQVKFQHEELPFDVEGKLFLNSLLNLTSSEISINRMAPGGGMPFYHKHELNEEIYIFIRGKGEFQVNGKNMPVSEGTVIRVAPDGERCWRNLSDEPLYYIVIQAKNGSYQHGATIEDGVGIQKEVSWNQEEYA